MEIDNTSLMGDVSDVLTSGPKPVSYYWEAALHIDSTGETVDVTKVMSIDTVRDYVKSFTETLQLKCALPRGKFLYRVYPNQDGLELTLRRRPLGELLGQDNPSETSLEYRYRAVLNVAKDFSMSSPTTGYMDEFTMDLSGFTEQTFQLMPKAMDDLRKVQCGAVFRSASVLDMLKYVMSREGVGLSLGNGDVIRGLDVAPPDNTKVYDQLVLPQDTYLTRVPEYIQGRYGVYSAGLGCFMQNSNWYVYPLYDPGRVNYLTELLTVIIVPKNRMPHIERTYLTRGSHTKILVTGDVSFTDKTQQHQINAGNGVRYSAAERMMEGSSVTTGGKLTLTRGNLNNEFIGSKRTDGNNFAPITTVATGNPLEQCSVLAQNSGTALTVTWQNSKPDVVVPGMRVRLVYIKDGRTVVRRATILAAHHYASLEGQGLLSARHSQQSALQLFTRPEDVE